VPIAELWAREAMKLNCPYCGETIPYDAGLAGQPVSCAYCEKTLKMPSVDELPPGLREEWLRTTAKAEEKQKKKYRRKQEAFLKGLEKEERRKLSQEVSPTEQASDARGATPPALPRSGAKPLGIVLVALYAAIAAWRSLSASQAVDSLGGALGGSSTELLKGLGESPLGGLLGGSGGLLEGGGTGGGGVVPVLVELISTVSLLSALLLAALCYGLLTFQRWSYRLTFLAYGMAGVVALALILVDNSRHNIIQQLPDVVAAIAVIVYFSQPRIKAMYR
jgi:hypothetical protein